MPISAATLNRVIDAAVKLIRESGAEGFESFSVHDLRRTASTQLHETGFNSDWIEKCLAARAARRARGVQQGRRRRPEAVDATGVGGYA